MKKYIWVTIVLIVIVGFGTYFGINGLSKPKSLNIGLISILSGEYANVGENVRNGALLASEIYNNAHPDAKINLFIEDDGFSGGRGLSAYQKLVGINHIDGLIDTSTATIDSIYDTVTKTNIPVIQVGEQGREPSPDNVFGIYPNSVASEYDYGVYMRSMGVKEMSLVYTNHDAMIRFVEAFKRGFQGKTTDFKIDAAEKDYRPHALKVSESNPSNIGLFIFPQQGAQFMKEYIKIAKNKPQFFFDTNFQSGYADYQRIMGNLKVLDGALIGTIESKMSDEFKIAYKTRFGTDAGFLTDIGYDAFNVLVGTYSENGTTWQNNIKTGSFDGAGGKIEFDSNGNRKPSSKIMVIVDGKIVDNK